MTTNNKRQTTDGHIATYRLNQPRGQFIKQLGESTILLTHRKINNDVLACKGNELN